MKSLIGEADPMTNLLFLRNQAREGDPWPYIRWQWGTIITAEEYLEDRSHWDSGKERYLILDNFQIDIISSVFDPKIREIWVKGNTGCGKGAAGGISTVAYYDCFNAQCVLTRDSADNCKTVVFGECISWWKRMRVRPPGKVGTTMIHAGERHWVRILNPKAEEGFVGVHGSAGTVGLDWNRPLGGTVYFWYDEGCHDAQTEILTERGWCKVNEYAGERVLGMNPETGVAEYVLPRGIHRTRRVGPMVSYRKRGMDFCITPNHRMLLYSQNRDNPQIRFWNEVETPGWKIKRTFNWQGRDTRTYLLPELIGFRTSWPARQVDSMAWAAFLGWFCSEGHIEFRNGRAYAVRISQTKSREKLESIHRLCESLGFKCSIRSGRYCHISERRLAEHLLSIVGEHATQKRIPAWVGEGTPEIIRVFLRCYRDGDGYYRPPRKENHRPATVYYTSSRAMADELQILSLKCGECATLTKRKWSTSMIDGREIRASEGYVVTTRSESWHTLKPADAEIIDYDGDVWCFDVPPHHVLMSRRNGVVMWSGNTAIPKSKFDAADTQAHKILVTGNPRTTGGPFRAAWPKDSALANQNTTRLGPKGFIRRITVDGDEIANVRLRRLEKPIAPAGGMEILGRRFNHGDVIPLDHFKLVTEIIPGQTCFDKHEVICSNADPNFVACMGHGHFPSEDPLTQLFFGHAVEHAMQRHDRYRRLVRIANGEIPMSDEMWWSKRVRKNFQALLRRCMPVEAIGLDVASSTAGGEDDTVAAFGGRAGCKSIEKCPDSRSTVTIVEWLFAICDSMGIDLARSRMPIGVDVIGIGKGVGDMLKAKKCRVIEIVASGSANVDECLNERAERFSTLATRLKLASNVAEAIKRDPLAIFADGFSGRMNWALPNNELLAEELAAHRKVYLAGDSFRFKITPKEEAPDTKEGQVKVATIKEIIGRSPDIADAVSNLWMALRAVPTVSMAAWVKALQN